MPNIPNITRGHPDPEVEESLRIAREEHQARREEQWHAYAESLRQRTPALGHTPLPSVEEREAAEAEAEKVKARKRRVGADIYR